MNKRRIIWVLFDESNGHPESRQYVWHFASRQLAREHKWRQEQMKGAAELSGPFRYRLTQ